MVDILNTFHWDVFAQIPKAGIYSALEIGTQEGNSLAAIVKAFPYLQRLAVCDDWGRIDGGTGRGTHNHIALMLDDLGYKGTRHYITGKSQVTVPTLIRAEQQYDLVHVDGDHSAVGARCDLENALNLHPKWVVVHDIFFPAVWEATSQWLMAHRGRMRSTSMSAHDTGTLVVELL